MLEKPSRTGSSVRSELIILLSQACELEHSLACSVFFTACSLKQSLEEGITRRQLELTNRWAEDLHDVALGKMLHFAQVWNLFTAVGCNPYHWRPSFPIPSQDYPTALPIELLPFGAVALERCLQFEVPDQGEGRTGRQPPLADQGIANAPRYRSVAQLYSVLRELIESNPEVEFFVGNPVRQVSGTFADFSSLIPVLDRASALRAIDLLRGRRVSFDPDQDHASDPPESRLNRNRHYDVLVRLQNEFRAEQHRAKQTGECFELVRDVLANPVLSAGIDDRVPIITQPQTEHALVGRLIQEPYARDVALLFEQVYSMMLGLLQYLFRKDSHDFFELRIISECAAGLLSHVLKPLAESLMLLPAGDAWSGRTAGPTFGMLRSAPLHPNPARAMHSVKARLEILNAHAAVLAKDDRVTAQLILAQRNLKEMRDRIRDGHLTCEKPNAPRGLMS